MRDTIYALASGRPPAAIALIRVSGDRAHDVCAAIAGDLPGPRQAALRIFRNHRNGEELDRGLVLRFDAPGSATGEDLVEFHCHGGRAVVDALLAAIGEFAGVRAAQPGEFTLRAFQNGRIDLTEAEGLADLLEAQTQGQRRAAILLAEGALRRQIDDWRERLLLLSAIAETAIDYVGDDTDDTDENLFRESEALSREVEAWLARPRAEILKDGVKVALAGPVNAGKSSLLNALVGNDKAIVTAIPGTTRDRIEVPVALGGVPFLLIDTAGLRSTTDEVEQIGISRSEAAIREADILVWLGSDPPPEHPRTIRVRSKCDLPESGERDGLRVSSKTGEGLDSLTGMLVEKAARLLPKEGDIAINRRQAEMLRIVGSELSAAGKLDDMVLAAEHLRAARSAMDRVTGRTGFEDVLDSIFGRFCLGK